MRFKLYTPALNLLSRVKKWVKICLATTLIVITKFDCTVYNKIDLAFASSFFLLFDFV